MSFVVLQVSDEDQGDRLDRFLQRYYPHITFVMWQKLLRKGQVRLDKKRAKGSERLHIGQEIRAYIPESFLQASSSKSFSSKSSSVQSFSNQHSFSQSSSTQLSSTRLSHMKAPPATPLYGERIFQGDHDKKRIKKAKDFFTHHTVCETPDVLVLNKPSGLAVQGGRKVKDSVDDFLGCISQDTSPPLIKGKSEKKEVSKRPQKEANIEQEKSWRLRLTHRIDKETSGLLVVARRPKVAYQITRMFKEKKIRKAYLAIVSGKMDVKECERVGEELYKISKPLLKDNIQGYEKVVISDRGKSAVTYFSIIKEEEDYSIVLLFPQTGRTHQLRVHTQFCKSPIIGDWKYGTRSSPPQFRKSLLFLHAFYLKIPSIGDFFAPIPEYFCDILEQVLLTEDDLASKVHIHMKTIEEGKFDHE